MSQRFYQLALTALLAGVLTGFIVGVVQSHTTTALILAAETLEGSDESDAHSTAQTSPHWQPAPGLERHLYTGLASVLTGIGYGLLVVATLSLLGRSGWRPGLCIGFVGFLVFQLAPALGLPPQVPGVPEVELFARQSWWLATVLTTAIGIGMLRQAWLRARVPWLIPGVLLIALPHVYGAPQPSVAVPAHLAALNSRFAITALAVSALFWVVLGASCGALLSWMRKDLRLRT